MTSVEMNLLLRSYYRVSYGMHHRSSFHANGNAHQNKEAKPSQFVLQHLP